MFSLLDAFNVTAKLDRATRLPSRPLVRTHCPGFYPGLDERARLLLRAVGRLPAIAGRPSRTDQMIFADMLNKCVDRTVSIPCRVLDLEADLVERLAFPSHFTRGEMPDRVAGHAGGIEVGLQVADRTAHRREAKTVSTALDRWLVEPRHVALARTVAGGMAVQTTRMRQHLAQFREYRRRPGRRIADGRKAFDAREIMRRGVGNGLRSQHVRRQDHDRNDERNPQVELHARLPS